jgi:murein DD-endopeptidase MepM/ murein hydrolase activator NlpD
VGGSSGLNNGVRLGGAEFKSYNGILGHQHVSGNLHGDPGRIDVTKVIAMASGIAIPPPTTPPPEVTPPPVTVEPYDIDLNGDVWIGLLKFGTTDSDSVRRMQKVLNGISLPPPGNVTIPLKPGNYGPMTDDVVRVWQLSIGDAPDPKGNSSVGPKQAAKLFSGTPCTLHAGVPGDSGSTGGHVSKVFADRLQDGVTDSDSVRAVQEALNKVSFPPHRNIPVNGNYDQTTKDMAAAFQRFIGDSADGYLGPKQTARLFQLAGMALEWHSESSGGGSGSTGGGGSPPPATTTGVSTPFPGAQVTTPYGKRGNWAAGFHTGVDYACGVGTPVRATWTGKVVAHNAWGAAYGKHVIYQATIDGQNTQIAYCHLSRIDAPVGSATRPGSHLGYSGNTGNTTGPHLHVEFRRNPYRYNNKCVPPQM